MYIPNAIKLLHYNKYRVFKNISTNTQWYKIQDQRTKHQQKAVRLRFSAVITDADLHSQ